MKKYLGLIKIYEDQMAGVNVRLLMKEYDDLEPFYLWFDMYPKSEHILFDNNEQLSSMFSIFRDMTPVTKEEQDEASRIEAEYSQLMKG